MSKKNKETINELYVRMLAGQYEDMATQMIEWDNLPDSIPKYVPERYLFQQGQCCVFKVPGTDEIGILPVAYGSVNLDIYGNPVEWRAYASGSTPLKDIINNMQLGVDNSVLIWNNQRRTGDMPYIEKMCQKMVNVDDTIDINVFINRTPVIVKATGKTLLTAKNMIKNYLTGEPYVIDGNYDVDTNTDVLNLNVPFIGDKLSDQYETYHNRIMRYLGIDHLPVEKQERMLTGEASSNQQEIEIRRQTRMAYRKKAVEQINDMFGTTIEVNYVEPDIPSNPYPMSGTPDAETGDGGFEEADGNNQ